MNESRAIAWTRFTLAIFSAALILSGATAIFAREGLRLLVPLVGPGSLVEDIWPSMSEWLVLVHQAIEITYDQYPFLAYGYDWLAFGHFIIAVPFIMAIRHPLRDTWVISCGIAACLAVLPFAVVFGAIRDIPMFWRGVDSLFGLGGLAVLLVLRRQLDLAARGHASSSGSARSTGSGMASGPSEADGR